jgi:hypothetical protein
LPDVPDSATTDICWDGGGGAQITLTVSGLSTSFLYDIAAVTSAINDRTDTVTVTGAGAPQASGIARSSSRAGQYHSFMGIAPTTGGVITIDVTDPQANNPIVNMVRMEAVPVPEPTTVLIWSLLAALGIGCGRSRRKK